MCSELWWAVSVRWPHEGSARSSKPREFVIADCTIDAVVNVVAATGPDALVLNLDQDSHCRLAASIAGAHPGMTVVACSAEGAAMRVYPRGGGGPVSSRSLSAAALDRMRSGLM